MLDPLVNLVALQAVAIGLGDLLPEVVFVGGVTVGLYASSPAAPESRPTSDVDCIVELASYGEFAALEERLRALGFRNDAESPVQIRWRYAGIPVDVMPTTAGVLGFSNPWYPAGMTTAEPYLLRDGVTTIRILHPAYLLATKFCALNARATDFRLSHDWEDIGYVLEECATIVPTVAAADMAVRQYVAEQCAAMLARPNATELLAVVLSRDGDLGRFRQTMRDLATLAA